MRRGLALQPNGSYKADFNLVIPADIIQILGESFGESMDKWDVQREIECELRGVFETMRQMRKAGVL